MILRQGRLSAPCATASRSRMVRMHATQLRNAPAAPSSIYDLAARIQDMPSEDGDTLRRIFQVTYGTATCSVSPQLSAKYSMEQDNKQVVISITNKWTYEQAWYNEVRSRKPQTFTTKESPVDPTGGGGIGKCDFCNWQELTAQDSWGRFENEHAVTGSNLFKYGQPFHGLALFKHHNPLDWSPQQLTALLQVSASWFAGAGAAVGSTPCTAPLESDTEAQPSSDSSGNNSTAQGGSSWGTRAPSWRGPLHGFFIWNALARAGASQFHGHAQLMATWTPVPTQALLDDQARAYQQATGGCDYLRDLLKAHGAAGLLRACAATPEEARHAKTAVAAGSREVGLPGGRAWLAASLSPTKDMEVLVAVQAAGGWHATATAAASSTSPSGPSEAPSPDRPATGLACPAFAWALHATLRALIDTLGIGSFNVGIMNVPTNSGVLPAGSNSVASGPSSLMLARIVSRGRMSQQASDFGCLEVLGGASIGHTDPYVVIAAVEDQLGECIIPIEAAPL